MISHDIYFTEEYGQASVRLEESGRLETFKYEGEEGRVRNMFIKRPLPESLDPEHRLFDIVTPYGYGGPLMEEVTGDPVALAKAYDEAFSEYCRQESIVCEFVRFHPMVKNHENWDAVYEVLPLRKTVLTILDGVEDIMLECMGKSTRKLIRKIMKSDIHTEIIPQPREVEHFKKIYYDTMERNEASEYYYFDDSYFQGLIDELGDHLVNVNIFQGDTCIASGLYFYTDESFHMHLSGTRHEFLHLSPAFVLKYTAMEWAKSKGIKYVHHGGGASNDPEDSLLKFKLRFTTNEPLDFYIGRKVFMQEVYDELVQVTNTQGSSYFPKYRGEPCKE